MISSIAFGVSFLIMACCVTWLGSAGRFIFSCLSFFSFVVAMSCHRKMVDRAELLETLMRQQVDVNNKVRKALEDIISKCAGDDLK